MMDVKIETTNLLNHNRARQFRTNGLGPNVCSGTELTKLSNDGFQGALLEGVSRTFALTIPELPKALCKVVSNAYLLCRIVDTIEDEVSLTPSQKRDFCQEFIQVVANNADAISFSRRLTPFLSQQTIPAEHELIKQIPRVIDITRGFDETQQQALVDCVNTMANGMPIFQAKNLKNGLETIEDMGRYCYYVAGCVGEMLAKLFCHYSADIAIHKEVLMPLSVSFGQGLQMTNILKDIWDDYDREVCWLPQEVFTETGFLLKDLSPEQNHESFGKGLEHLISIAHSHLANALKYTLLIPKEEIGIRKFCLWAIGMAVLTLRKIKNNLNFSQSKQVKISRRSVKTTIWITNLACSNNTLLKILFNVTGAGLSSSSWQAKPVNSQNNHQSN